MPDLTITEVEVAKEMPTWQGKGAKVYRLTVEGDERKPEKFVPNDKPAPEVGETIPGIENSDYGPKVAGGKSASGGFKRSPAETKKIVRQHSQHMALLREANLVAGGRSPLQGDELRSLIQWFDDDVAGKASAVSIDGNTSDVPGDMADLIPGTGA